MADSHVLENHIFPIEDMKEDIVISGISGRFPESDNYDEFKKNLLNGVDLVTEDDRRWKPGLFGIPKRHAKLKDVTKLDTVYFGVHAKQADAMDPQQRILLEVVYEALVDSGYSANSLRGDNIGVFVGQSFSESGEAITTHDYSKVFGYHLTGNCKALMANRVSYTFDFKGPSFTVDTACSSSFFAFHQAMLSMRTNQCDAAIVAGVSLTLNPLISLQFNKLCMLSEEGKCKVFDAAGDGYVRAETVSAIFLQKAKNARRIYATVLHTKVNSDGAKAEGVTYPSGKMQQRLLEQVYREAEIDPKDIDYVEAHGTGTKVGDPEELGAIDEVFCTNRIGPLPIGSVKSNMGHSEPASGLCSLAKVIVALEEGIVPPNLHFNTPNPNVPGLMEGRIKVVDKPFPLKAGAVVGLNSFGFGGSNAHLVIKGNDKLAPNIEKPRTIPRLATVSGRNAANIDILLDRLESQNYSNEALVLIEETNKTPTSTMPFRGFILLDDAKMETPLKAITDLEQAKDETELKEKEDATTSKETKVDIETKEIEVQSDTKETENESDTKEPKEETDSTETNVESATKATTEPIAIERKCVRVVQRAPLEKLPLWFMFSGMGSQWPEMAKDMMKIDSFANSLKRSAEILKPYDIDLIELLTKGTENDLLNTTNCFVSIAAVQVALYDIIRDLDIEPDGIIGHSLGETGCSYADGCFDARQTLLCAYWRGRACQLTELPLGGMAAVGLSWEDAKERCPEGVYPACHNAADSVTISGPVVPLRKFIEELKKEDIFAREVNSCDIAFHSKYIYPMAEILKKNLDEVIPNPKPRTSRWLSSSIPQEKWTEPLSQLSSADYHVNNLTSPVLFHDALSIVPKNAIVIEIAPHGLFQSIVKRTLGPDCTYISLMKKGHENNADHFLSAIGSMFNAGLHPTIKNLYDPVTYPVSRGTPSISSLVLWDHSRSWVTPGSNDFAATKKSSDRQYEIDCYEFETPYKYILDHKVDGRVLFPATGYLMLAWEAVAKQKQSVFSSFPIVFEKVSLHRATIVPMDGQVTFNTVLHMATGEFEVNEGGMVVAKGFVYCPEDPVLTLEEQIKKTEYGKDEESEFTLDSKDFYKELRLRGYEYGPLFQGVIEAKANGMGGKLRWDGNWVTFMDSMLQFPILGMKSRGLYLPTRFQKVTVIPSKQPDPAEVKEIEVRGDPYINACAAGAVEIEGLKCTIAPRRHAGLSMALLESYEFVPNYDNDILSEKEINDFLEYSQVCSSLTLSVLNTGKDSIPNFKELTRGLREVPEDLITKYTENKKDNYILFNALKEMLENKENLPFEENIKTNMTKIDSTIENDLLKSSILNKKAARTSFDLVMENLPCSGKIKVLEAVKNHSILSSILKYNYNATIEFDYTIGETETKPAESSDEESNGNKIKLDLDSEEGPTDSFDLVLSRNLCTVNNGSLEILEKALATMNKAVKDKGFIIIIERTKLTPCEKILSQFTETKLAEVRKEDLEKAFARLGLTIVAKKVDGMTSVMYVLRKQTEKADVNELLVIDINNSEFETWLEPVKKALEENEKDEEKKIIWLKAENPTTGIVGLVNCLSREPGGGRVRCVFNANLKQKSIPYFNANEATYANQISKDLVMNVYRDGQWGTFRHFEIPSSFDERMVPQPHAYLTVVTPGDLSSLRFIQSPPKLASKPTDPEQMICHVYYAPLNFRDIMLASGRIPPDAIPGFDANNDNYLGLEFAGREATKEGRRVMGFIDSSGIASTVLVNRSVVLDVPDDWTMEQACTVPAVYLTVYYALIERARCQKGESILIHSGSGGVGQAAIRLALALGCEVYTTVGSEEKREFLKKTFPQLKDRNFSNSRDLTFEYDIKRETKGKGVDVVLNSLAEEKLHASFRCLAKHGRFLEIGKFDLAKNESLGMYAFLNDISFHGIFLDTLFYNDNLTTRGIRDRLMRSVERGIKSGIVKPLDTTVYPMEQVEDAFRFMASGKHIGKVVIKIRDEETSKFVSPKSILVPAIPKSFCNPKKTYIITGGLGGFGLELAGWLIGRGCTKLVLTSRTGVQTGYQKFCLDKWEGDGMNIVVSTKDVSNKEDTLDLINDASKLGPIGGVFHLAMVLKDAVMQNQTVENYIEVTNPKVLGIVHLDETTRNLCPELDWFVTFSSVSCGRGNPGQTNYGFSNSAMERICEQRKNDGLPGLAVQWGIVGDVGVVQEAMAGKPINIGGIQAQSIKSCLATMDYFLYIATANSKTTPSPAVLSSFVPAESILYGSGEGGKRDLLLIIGRILGLKDIKSMDGNITLGELGLDSLMGVEVKQLLEREYNLNLNAQEIRSMSLKRLDEIGKGGPVNSSTNENMASNLIDKFENEGFEVGKVAILKVPNEPVIYLNDKKTKFPIFMVHNVEGFSDMLKTVSSHLNITSIGLQCTEDMVVDTIQDLASHHLKEIIKIQPEGPYNICGYSFGGLVAFEIAMALQKKLGPQKGVKTLVFLDGSPDFVMAHHETKDIRLNRLEDEGPVGVLKTFLGRYTNNPCLEMIDNIRRDLSWDEQLNETCAIFLKNMGVKLDKDELAKACGIFYTKYLAVNKYKSSGQFQGDVILIKAETDTGLPSNLPADYGLSKNVVGNVQVHTVAGNHRSFIQESADKVAEIIGSLIHDKFEVIL